MRGAALALAKHRSVYLEQCSPYMTPLQQHEIGVFLTYSAREFVERRPLAVTPLQYVRAETR